MHRVKFSSIVRKYIDVFKMRAFTRRNALSARVLVVDDNLLVRKGLRFMLTHARMKVVGIRTCCQTRQLAEAGFRKSQFG